MKLIENFEFEKRSIREELIKKYEDDSIINYEEIMLINPITKIEFPDFDEPYYSHMEYTLRHLLYKFEKGWITSPRQVMHSSDECISTVHFIFNEKNEPTDINVFQRSSNINNIEEDSQFLRWFSKKYIKNNVNINIFVSIPHEFKNKRTKVD